MTKGIRIFIFLLLLLAIVLANMYLRPTLVLLPTYIESYKQFAVVVFAAVYVLGTVLFLPGLTLTLAAGFLFGPWLGTVVALTSATLGATVAFLLARYLFSSWAKSKTSGILKKLVDGINEEGWRFVAFVRLVPLFPFNLVNYAFGLTQVKVFPYMLSSFIFMAPGAFVYSYLGSLGQDFLHSDISVLIRKILLGITLIAVVSFLPYFIKKKRGQRAS